MLAAIEKNLKDIERVCIRRSVSKLFTFGSINTNRFNEQSDVDFLVEFKEMVLEKYADNYLDLCYELEEILKRKVDLVTTNSVRNPIFEEQLENTKHLIFKE